MIALLIAAAVAAQANEPPARALVYGTGTATCASWSEDRGRGEQSTARIHDVAWLMGFVSGVNATGRYGGNVTEGQGSQDMTAWVDTYCSSHPSETVFDAAAELILELDRRQRGSAR